MKWKDLGKYYLQQRIKYEVKQDWSAELAIFGALSDTVNFLMDNSNNKDRDKATELVWDFCVIHWKELVDKCGKSLKNNDK